MSFDNIIAFICMFVALAGVIGMQIIKAKKKKNEDLEEEHEYDEETIEAKKESDEDNALSAYASAMDEQDYPEE